MSGQPAARLTDNITCLVPQVVPATPPPPHAIAPGLPITGIGAANVMIGGQPAARVSDFSICISPAPLPNPILRGAFPVPVLMMPAARLTDQATHPGSLITGPCCPTVLIGLAGTTGNPSAGADMCNTMGAGRNPAPGATDAWGNPLAANSGAQDYNNCGVESSRQVIGQATGATPTQEGLLNTSVAAGNADAPPAIGSVDPGTGQTVTAQNATWFSGGTSPTQQANILSANGVPATSVPALPGGQQLSQFETALSQGRGVLTGGDVAGLPGWGGQSGGHAVLVTGYTYDDAGNITTVHYNDTGIGVCGQTATAAQFQNAMNIEANNMIANGQTPFGAAVTDNPIWW